MKKNKKWLLTIGSIIVPVVTFVVVIAQSVSYLKKEDSTGKPLEEK